MVSMTSFSEVFANNRGLYQVANVLPEDVLNVRQYPSSRASVLLQLPADARWIKRTSQRRGHWQKVVWGTSEGWVYDRYLSSDAAATQVSNKHRQCVKNNPTKAMCCGFTGSSDNEIKVYKIVGVPRGQSLNVRASGTFTAKRISNIPHDGVGIVKFPNQKTRQRNSLWQKIRWNGRDGWVNSSFLKYDQVLSDYRNLVRKTCSR